MRRVLALILFLASPVFAASSDSQLLDAVRAGQDGPLSVEDHGDPIRRQLAFGQEKTQGSDIEPGPERIFERSALPHRHRKANRRHFEHEASEKVRDRGLPSVEGVTNILEMSDGGQLSAKGTVHIDELLARDIGQVDRDPTWTGRHHPLSLSIE